MGLLGKTVNGRTTLERTDSEVRLRVVQLTGDEAVRRDKEAEKKFLHLKKMIEEGKRLTKVNQQQLLNQWVDLMKTNKANKLSEEIFLQNQLFER